MEEEDDKREEGINKEEGLREPPTILLIIKDPPIVLCMVTEKKEHVVRTELKEILVLVGTGCCLEPEIDYHLQSFTICRLYYFNNINRGKQ